MRVGGGGHNSGRLVQQVVGQVGGKSNADAIDFDQIAQDVHPTAKLRGFAVHRNAAVGDHVIDNAAAAKATDREHLLQANAFGRDWFVSHSGLFRQVAVRRREISFIAVAVGRFLGVVV